MALFSNGDSLSGSQIGSGTANVALPPLICTKASKRYPDLRSQDRSVSSVPDLRSFLCEVR